MFMWTDIDLKCCLWRDVFLLQLHLLSVGQLLPFGCDCCFVAWALMQHSPVLGTQPLSQPLGARAPCRGGEQLRTRCAPRRLVAVEPLVGMLFAHHCAVIDCPLVDRAACSQQNPLFLLQRLQGTSAVLAAESAWPLQAHPIVAVAIHRTAHSAPHKQNIHTLSASGTRHCRSASHGSEMAPASLPLCGVMSCS
jgi:hypothetical protein